MNLIKEDFLKKWVVAVSEAGIPQQAYDSKIKLLENSDYSIGALFNPHRFERKYQNPNTDSSKCKLCSELEDSLIHPFKDLAPGISKNFLVTYNAFPHFIGSSMAIAKNINGKEKAMYNTKNLFGLVSELDEIFKIGEKLGLKVFHNTFGAGASIPSHEHWHLLHPDSNYKKLGVKYGFDASEKKKLKGNEKVKIMPSFPFAHLIFDSNDFEKIVFFFKNLGDNLGKNYPYGHVPHSICQGHDGILIVPNKIHKDRPIGSTDIAGHYLSCKNLEEFENMNLDDYISKLDEILFRKEDIDLKMFL